MRPTAATLALAALLSGCATAADPSTAPAPARGRGRPLPAAAQALVNASVQVTFRAAVASLSDVPLELEQVDEEQGVVETREFNLEPFEWSAERYPPDERVVRMRVTVQPDTLGRGSRVAVFVLYQPQRGRMIAGRASERAVPSDHPGAVFARKLMERLERKATGT